MAFLDLAGFIAEVKNLAAEHGFHIHDERHFVETYSMRQAWEVDLHPEEACGGPIEMHFGLDVDPRTVIAFEDQIIEVVNSLDEIEPDEIEELHYLPLIFNWSLPPLPHCPDLLLLATDLAGVGGPELPTEVTAIDSYMDVTDASERRVNVAAKVMVSLTRVYLGDELLDGTFERCLNVSRYLLDRVPAWIDGPNTY